MACYTLFGFISEHIDNKKYFQLMVQKVESKYGKEVNLDEVTLKYVDTYRPYFEKKSINYLDYISGYNSGNFFTNGQYEKYLVIGWLIFFPGFLWLFGYLAFFTAPTHLIADRKRRLLYTYGMGKVYLTRYDDAQMGYAGKMIAIKLYRIDDKTGQLSTMIFRPNVSHYSSFLTSTDSENHRFITFLNAYMQQGRDAVSPTDYQARPPLLCFGKNPRPEDFELQVQQILAKLDEKERVKCAE